MTDLLKSLTLRDIDPVPQGVDRLDGYRSERVPNRIDAESAYALRLENTYLRETFSERK